jgi:hypothetical protein
VLGKEEKSVAVVVSLLVCLECVVFWSVEPVVEGRELSSYPVP